MPNFDYDAYSKLISTVNHLRTSDFQVRSSLLGRDVIDSLETNKELPGVLIVDGENFVGAISRQKCFEQIGRPYGVEVFLNRSIAYLYKAINMPPLIVPHNTHIDFAVKMALNRPDNQIYEPLVVEFAHNKAVRLLDMHVLLSAQSALLENTNHLIKRQIDVWHMMSSSLEVKDVFHLILEYIIELIPSDQASVLLQNGQSLELVAARGFDKNGLSALLNRPIYNSLLYQNICRSYKSFSVPDVSHLKQWELGGSLHAARSWLGVPLMYYGNVIGILSLSRISLNPYTESDGAVAKNFANQAASAIQNARAFEQQRQVAEELAEADRVKTQFLTNMSHELRTPLNSIIGFARVMMKGIDGPITELQQQDLTSIYQSGHHLLGLINDILDISKIEAGKMELQFERIDLSPIIHSVMSTASGLIKDKPIEIAHHLEPNLPMIDADSIRVRQIFLNLISNACKFTEDGKIELIARYNDTHLTFEIRDTGIGIPLEMQQKLFKPFSQVDTSSTRKTNGTGLGLSITRYLVEMHGGSIQIDSTVGKGSSFIFTLPIRQSAETEDQKKSFTQVPTRLPLSVY